MNPELKARWLVALRSGKYKQTRRVLKNDAGFCCLGVLCDLINPNVWVKSPSGGYNHNDGVSSTPSSEIPSASKTGITDLDHAGRGAAGILANMNDHGKSFREIADYIEKNL